jgi:hypothetical protein
LPARVRALSLTICELQQPLIGICPAKVILGTDSILWRQTEEKEHTYPAIESSSDHLNPNHLHLILNRNEHTYPALESSAHRLNPNHSHFILVEDEDGTGFGVEHALRGEFEKCLGGEEAYEGHEEDSSYEEDYDEGTQKYCGFKCQKSGTPWKRLTSRAKKALHRVPVVSICGTEPCTQHYDTRASARGTL